MVDQFSQLLESKNRPSCERKMPASESKRTLTLSFIKARCYSGTARGGAFGFGLKLRTMFARLARVSLNNAIPSPSAAGITRPRTLPLSPCPTNSPPTPHSRAEAPLRRRPGDAPHVRRPQRANCGRVPHSRLRHNTVRLIKKKLAGGRKQGGEQKTRAVEQEKGCSISFRPNCPLRRNSNCCSNKLLRSDCTAPAWCSARSVLILAAAFLRRVLPCGLENSNSSAPQLSNALAFDQCRRLLCNFLRRGGPSPSHPFRRFGGCKAFQR